MGRKNKTTSGSPRRPPSKIWGGRFSSGPDPSLAALNASLPIDRRLALEDVEASMAHAAMLGETGIISSTDARKLLEGLQKIESELLDGTFPFDDELEDIHMNIESRLGEKIGEVAGKLHTARSRNDQVATDFRIWVRKAIDEADSQLLEFQQALLDLAERHAGTVMPGLTHLQPAQPITFGHHMMAYFEMAKRDRARLQDCRSRLNECPLGAAALAGTSFPIDRSQTSRELGFDAPMRNSVDAVASRDFALEFLSALAIASVHLSRLAEEIVLWASPVFDYIKLPDAFSTGSSIMPQKRNPDGAELVRAKSGRLLGNLSGLLSVMKGLPLAYVKDLQEDKEPVFDSSDTFMLCLKVMTGMLNNMEIVGPKMEAATHAGFITATDAADWLVKELNMPFRQAHHAVGRMVLAAEKKGVELADLSLPDLQKIVPGITDGIFEVLSPKASVESRRSFGGTSVENVRAAIEAARKELK